ncbi:MAG: substrate-binding domain-containing protein, partial [Anaerolineae bacterium]|nr:substrate-binding domain-containing protein [Anaerolineae bacterium]
MTEKILSRRDFLRAAALSTGAAVLGPGNLSVLANPPAQSASITYLDVDESGAGDEAYAVYQQLAEMFMDSHPDIEVRFQPALEGWSDALVTDMVAGVAADIFPHYAGFGRPLMENGQTLALDDYFSAEDLADFYEEQILAVELEGRLYGLPKYLSSIAIAYNKGMLDEAGVTYPGEDLDWETFFAAVSQAAQLGPNESGARFGYNVNLGYSNHWVWQNGGEWMNAPVLGTKILINEPPALEALQRLYDLVFVEHSAPTVQDIEGLGWPQVFQTGRFAFVEGHSWQVNEWVRTIDFDWDYATLPAGSAGRIGTVFNDSYSIW